MKSENEINLPFFFFSLDLHDVYDLYQEQQEDNFSSTELMSKEIGYFQRPQGNLLLDLLQILIAALTLMTNVVSN